MLFLRFKLNSPHREGRQIMQLKNDDELTSDEARRLESAFGDDEFCQLMAEYANELADPKYKEEQEAYLALLETNNELPSGKVLVWPSSGFVVKCMHRKRRETNGSSGSSSSSKLFLNIVYSDKVAEPVEQQQLEGSKWSVPYALGPVRMELDKSGSTLIPTFDCCFHPLSLRHAHANKKFLNLLIDIAKDAVMTAFTTSGDMVDILDGYTILRGVLYKTGKPRALMMIMMPNEFVAEKDEDMNIIQPTPQDVEESSNLSSSPEKLITTEIRIPKYKIVEQHAFDIAEPTLTMTPATSQKPSHLVVTVYLDTTTKSVDEINLQVHERELTITPNDEDNNVDDLLQPSCRYKLNVILPYPVDERKGNASFDTNRSLLIVTLPVVA